MSFLLISIFVLLACVLLLVFWFRGACRAILRTSVFDRDYCAEIAAATQLNFLAIRKALEESTKELADEQPVLATLQRDSAVLIYLLGHAATLHLGRYSRHERYLIVHFHLLQLWIRLKRWLGLGWKSRRATLLEMTEILRYFANVLGRRAATFPATFA